MNIVVPCMGWIPVCWRELLGLFSQNTDVIDHDLPDLPDSIIENILSRLSAKCIIQCQRDSKALQVLTETPYFSRMQLNRSSPPPMIILQAIPKSVSDGSVELCFIDAESHNIERELFELDSCYMQKDNPILLLGSHDGFLLFANNRYSKFMPDHIFYVWNPTTNQKITFRLPRPKFCVCGFYFCSLKMEYVLLLVSISGVPFEFKTFNLGTKSYETVGNFSYPPSCNRPAVIVNKTLYWMVDRWYFEASSRAGDYSSRSHFVVSFEIETKKFETIGDDGLFGIPVPHILRVHLFKLQEELYICHFTERIQLELSLLNQETKSWVKKHTVSIHMLDVFTLDGCFGRWPNRFTVEVFQYKKGELLLRKDKCLYIYNLYSNTFRRVESNGFGEAKFQTVVHVDSLVSL